MGSKGGGSSSSSSNSTSSTSEDNKVSATDNAIALGKDSQFSYVDEFSDNVAKAFSDLVDLVRDGGSVAVDAVNNAVSSNERAMQLIAERAKQAEDAENLKDGVLIKDIFPMLVLGVLGFGAIFAFKTMKRKK